GGSEHKRRALAEACYGKIDAVFGHAKRNLLITRDVFRISLFIRSRRFRHCGIRCLADLADKAEASSCNGANPALLLTIISNCAPGGVDPNRNGGIRYDPAAPG